MRENGNLRAFRHKFDPAVRTGDLPYLE